MRPFLLALITLFSNATWAAAESIDVKYYGNNWDPANGIMSALLPTADIHQGDGHVRKVPCVDGSELARAFFTFCRIGRCSHVFGL